MNIYGREGVWSPTLPDLEKNRRPVGVAEGSSEQCSGTQEYSAAHEEA